MQTGIQSALVPLFRPLYVYSNSRARTHDRTYTYIRVHLRVPEEVMCVRARARMYVVHSVNQESEGKNCRERNNVAVIETKKKREQTRRCYCIYFLRYLYKRYLNRLRTL